MCFRLVHSECDLSLELPFEDRIEFQLLEAVSQGGADGEDSVRLELARRIVDRLTAMLECEALAPTDKQLRYAVAIAKELNLELPAMALRHREAMAAFLGKHAPEYRRRRGEGLAGQRYPL